MMRCVCVCVNSVDEEEASWADDRASAVLCASSQQRRVSTHSMTAPAVHSNANGTPLHLISPSRHSQTTRLAAETEDEREY